MTRDEAVEMIREEYADPNRLIRALEALGLLKFEEEKEEKTAIQVIADVLLYHVPHNFLISDDIKIALEKHGYLIVKVKHTKHEGHKFDDPNDWTFRFSST